MTIAVILAGGIGSRMRTTNNIPKQYLKINNRIIISFCLETFEKDDLTDKIYIVADKLWRDVIDDCIKSAGITKFKGYCEPGETRQLSIYNSLKVISETVGAEDVVIIHDAARPLVTKDLIDECYKACEEYDGAMPVLPVKDTFYMSSDGTNISSLLKRSELFAGQAPESFKFRKYYEVHNKMSVEDIKKINGSSEIAYINGLNVKMISGDERNFKITTQEDLKNFERILQEND